MDCLIFSDKLFGNDVIFATSAGIMQRLRLALIGLTLLALSACQLPETFVRQEVIRKPILVQPADSSSSPLYVWHGSGQPGPVCVTIDLSEQKAYIFKNNQNLAYEPKLT